MDWGRAEGCQAGGQKTAPGHGREPQADGLGGKQRQSEGGTLQEAGGKDDEGSVPQEACSGKETPLKAGSGEGGNLQEAGEGEVEGGSPQEEGEVEGGSPLEEGEVEGGSPLVKGEVEGESPLVEGQVEGGSPLVEGQVEGGSPLEEGLEGEPPSGRSGGGPPQAGAEGVPPLDGLQGGPPPAGAEGGPPQAGAQGGPPQAGEEASPPLEGEEWAQEPDRPRGPESVRELECQEEPGAALAPQEGQWQGSHRVRASTGQQRPLPGIRTRYSYLRQMIWPGPLQRLHGFGADFLLQDQYLGQHQDRSAFIRVTDGVIALLEPDALTNLHAIEDDGETLSAAFEREEEERPIEDEIEFNERPSTSTSQLTSVRFSLEL
ncbi:unnamed protein product [Boreogadus saida]